MDSIEHNELRVRQGEHKNDSEKKRKKKKKKKAGKRNQCEAGESSEYLQQTRPFSRKHNNDAPQRGERYFSIMLIQVNAL